MLFASRGDAKGMMIRFRTSTPTALALAASAMIAGSITAGADGISDAARVAPSSGRCAGYGAEAVDMGNGLCGRLGARTRIEVHPRTVTARSWTVNGTSSANLRSEGTGGMVPGAYATEHLRVRSGLDSYNPFR